MCWIDLAVFTTGHPNELYEFPCGDCGHECVAERDSLLLEGPPVARVADPRDAEIARLRGQVERVEAALVALDRARVPDPSTFLMLRRWEDRNTFIATIPAALANDASQLAQDPAYTPRQRLAWVRPDTEELVCVQAPRGSGVRSCARRGTALGSTAASRMGHECKRRRSATNQ